MNAFRLILISCLVTVVGAGLFLWLILGFSDQLTPTDPPPTLAEYAVRCVTFLICWPTVVVATIFGETSGAAFWLLFIPSGLVWAAIVELILRCWRGGWPNHALQRTRPSRPGCHPRLPRGGSLSLGR
jgi:hypothetical protein